MRDGARYIKMTFVKVIQKDVHKDNLFKSQTRRGLTLISQYLSSATYFFILIYFSYIVIVTISGADKHVSTSKFIFD